MNDFTVLMYHEIVKEEDFDYDKNMGIEVNQNYQDKLPKILFCYLKNFEEQMEYLYNNGYQTISLKDIKAFYNDSVPLPNKAVLITFDDLYKSVMLYAYPILKKYSFHAVGFVVKDWLFKDVRDYTTSKSVCLSIDEVNQIGDVFEFANHTSGLHTREGATTALISSSIDNIEDDLMNCEKFVNTKKVFAYPFGIYDKNTVESIRKLGFELAFTTENGINTKETDTLMLKRNGVFIHYDLDAFKKLLTQ